MPSGQPVCPGRKGAEMTRKDLAMDYFTRGCNCAQAVVLAFAPETGMDPGALARLSSSFGGGLGRLREVCGAVSGMAIVAGLLYGYDDPADGQAKAAHYERIQTLAKKFEAENGSIICRELLGLNRKHDAPVPEARSADFYKKRPCRELVGMAAEILDEYINNNPPKEG